MLQVDFMIEFFTLVKKFSPLTTLIETNGFAGPEAYRPLLKTLDMTIIDLKDPDSQRYQALTGGGLLPTLETIRFLHGMGKLYTVQQVVAPGYTDSEASAAATASLLVDIDPQIRLKFLRFRPHGTSGQAETWASPSDEVMDQMVNAALQAGLKQVERSL